MIDITILTKYTSQGASSRYRYFLYINNILKQDTNIEIDSFLDTSYLYKLYNKKKKNKLKILISYFKRILVLINSSNNLIVEYETLPYIPYFIEKIFLKNKRYILNFDDNVWDNYKNKKLLANKFDELVINANGIIVANSYLENKVSKLNYNVIKIPTVIDLDSYKTDNIDKFEKFTLVWIGSPSTYKYIQSHADIFRKVSGLIDYKLVIIASKSLENEAISGVSMEFLDWSSSIEVEILKKAHVGVMPLDNDNFSLGKSSFKIIQYMAAGLPTIASSIGENNNVVKNNETGFLVDSEDDWIDSIMKLHDDKDLYRCVSEQSKSKAYEYSIQKYFVEFHKFIQKIFKVDE